MSGPAYSVARWDGDTWIVTKDGEPFGLSHATQFDAQTLADELTLRATYKPGDRVTDVELLRGEGAVVEIMRSFALVRFDAPLDGVHHALRKPNEIRPVEMAGVAS